MGEKKGRLNAGFLSRKKLPRRSPDYVRSLVRLVNKGFSSHTSYYHWTSLNSTDDDDDGTMCPISFHYIRRRERFIYWTLGYIIVFSIIIFLFLLIRRTTRVRFVHRSHLLTHSSGICIPDSNNMWSQTVEYLSETWRGGKGSMFSGLKGFIVSSTGFRVDRLMDRFREDIIPRRGCDSEIFQA